MDNLETLLERLIVHRVEFVLVGGLAATMYGVSIMTKDVDVCIPITAENLVRIENALADLHPRHRMTTQHIPFVLSEGIENHWKNIYLKTDIGVVDFLGDVMGVGKYAAALEASVGVPTDAGEYRMLNLDTLIAAKKAVGRDKDLATVQQLQAIREGGRPRARETS